MIQLYNDDCFNILAQIPDKSVDLILIDPPYNTLSGCKKSWDKSQDYEELFKEYWRVLKTPGVIISFADCGKFMKVIMNADKNYKYTLIWEKNFKGNFLNAKKSPLTQYESIKVFYKKAVYNPQMIKGEQHIRGNGSSDSSKAFNIENCGNDYYSEEYYPTNILKFDALPLSSRYHTSQKPVDLLEWLIKSYSNDDAVVMATFMLRIILYILTHL